jgi:deazaflavin-dependent oxidoreductase (nitroreductase family)
MMAVLLRKKRQMMRLPKPDKGHASPRYRWMAGYLLLTLLMVLLMNRERLLNQIRFFNRRVLNPMMLRSAGREGVYDAVVQHVGRASGKPYRTPVVATPIQGGFVIPLPYGTKVDWLRNIQAAGGAALTWNGRDYSITEPIVINAAAARALLPSARWWTYRLFGITHFLQVSSRPLEAVEAPPQTSLAEPVPV